MRPLSVTSIKRNKNCANNTRPKAGSKVGIIYDRLMCGEVISKIEFSASEYGIINYLEVFYDLDIAQTKKEFWLR